LIAHFKTFTPLVIVSAGLIDGINPCAFTVIVFFISFLALQGYKRRDLVFIGLTFIFAVFLTYTLIGIGLFGFLYRLKGFWLVVRITNLSIGIFSVALGICALYDFFKFKKTGHTEGLLLQLPQAIKNQIHSVIGMHYRKTKIQEVATVERNIFRLILSALITGFLVSILEAVCTGQTYLPTITFILKTTNLRLQALGYLLLYNLMFIVPLFIIFLFALLGATSEQFSEFLKKHLLTVKILMAILFFGLGIFLIWGA
jgi:cytochrome c biogenesis protein CcdA